MRATWKNTPALLKATPEKLAAAGCDVLFKPAVDEMYTPGETWHLDIGPLEHLLEGRTRPGHYQGVTQVVAKLFNIIGPDIAFFRAKGLPAGIGDKAHGCAFANAR